MASFAGRRYLRLDTTEHLYDAIVNNDATHAYYFFLGKTFGWSGDPETGVDSLEYTNFTTWDRIIALKQINASDVSLALPRYNWASGNVYRKYKSYVDVHSNQAESNAMYVVTSDFRVYKCIDNNKGVASTIEPLQTDAIRTFKTSDGYEWKYMFPVVGSDQQKFISTEYIAVKTVTSADSFNTEQYNIQLGATDGTVDTVDVIAGGANYINFAGYISDSNTTVIYVSDTLYGANRTDDDYYNGCSLFVESGRGRGNLVEIADYQASTAKITLSTPLTTALNISTVTDASYIVIGPKVTINGNGVIQAEAYANVNINSSNTINSINMVNKGLGITSSSITITDSTFVGSVGTGAIAIPNISPIGGHGSNALRELGSGALMLSTRLRGNEELAILNDAGFAMYGLLENPQYANGVVVNETTVDTTTKLNLTNLSGITNATAVSGWTVKGLDSFASAYAFDVVTTADGANGILSVTERDESNGAFVATETIELNNDAAISGRLNSVTESIAKRYTGDIVYIENRELVQRATTQSEDFKIVLQF
jgi:hypothetical protein